MIGCKQGENTVRKTKREIHLHCRRSMARPAVGSNVTLSYLPPRDRAMYLDDVVKDGTKGPKGVVTSFIWDCGTIIHKMSGKVKAILLINYSPARFKWKVCTLSTCRPIVTLMSPVIIP